MVVMISFQHGRGEKLNKAIKNSKLVVIENSSHFPYIENEKEFFKIVEGFLKAE